MFHLAAASAGRGRLLINSALFHMNSNVGQCKFINRLEPEKVLPAATAGNLIPWRRSIGAPVGRNLRAHRKPDLLSEWALPAAQNAPDPFRSLAPPYFAVRYGLAGS